MYIYADKNTLCSDVLFSLASCHCEKQTMYVTNNYVGCEKTTILVYCAARFKYTSFNIICMCVCVPFLFLCFLFNLRNINIYSSAISTNLLQVVLTNKFVCKCSMQFTSDAVATVYLTVISVL